MSRVKVNNKLSDVFSYKDANPITEAPKPHLNLIISKSQSLGPVSEISQTEKDKYPDVAYMWNHKKWYNLFTTQK